MALYTLVAAAALSVGAGASVAKTQTAAAPLPIPTLTLRGVDASGKPTTVPMPTIGLGTGFGFTPPGSTTGTYDGVLTWLKAGGRALHAARMYCNQEAVGLAIRDSGVPREELFVMTMIPQWHMGTAEAAASVEVSLKQLNLTYVDLVMVHWPGTFEWSIPMYPTGDKRCGAAPLPHCHMELCGDVLLEEPKCKAGEISWKKCRQQTWGAFKALQAKGLARTIGVSNFETWMLAELDPPAAVNQIPWRVGFHDDVLAEYSKKHGTVSQSYSPLAGSALAKAANDSTIGLIAAAHKVSAAQVALRYIVQSGGAAIPKSSTTAYMKEDADVFSWSLSSKEMLALALVNTPSAEGAKSMNDPTSMMCQNKTSGRMARCLYLDIPGIEL